MSDWLPIESAPKDGTPILLHLERAIDRHYSVMDDCPLFTIGFWRHNRWQSIEGEDQGSMGGEYTGWMPDWVNLTVLPTHWMPLPDAPAQGIVTEGQDAERLGERSE